VGNAGKKVSVHHFTLLKSLIRSVNFLPRSNSLLSFSILIRPVHLLKLLRILIDQSLLNTIEVCGNVLNLVFLDNSLDAAIKHQTLLLPAFRGKQMLVLSNCRKIGVVF
jgi:hypothetical protein